MSEWRYGRYFLLEGDVNHLFLWLNKNIGYDWKVTVLGVCPTEGKLILNTVFEHENHRKLFEDEFIGDQSPYCSVYNNRRKPNYKWPMSVERRANTDRRADIHRRNPKRMVTRRLEDVVKRASFKKKLLSLNHEELHVLQ